MQPCQEKKLNVDGLTIAAKCWGNPKNPPILALHGWLDNAASFDLLAPQLSEWYVVAIDLLGHGLSDHLPENAHYHLIDSVEFVTSVAHKLEWKQFGLLGHSLGGCISTLVAGTSPKNVTQLFLIDGFGPVVIPESDMPKLLQNYLSQVRHGPPNKPRIYQTLDDAIAARLKNSDLTYNAAAILASRGVRAIPEGFQWQHDPRLLLNSPMYFTEPQVIAFIKKIEAPITLILTPAFSDLINPRTAYAKQISTHHISGGHHIHLEKENEIANIIIQAFS